MVKRLLKKPKRWRKVPRDELSCAEGFLRTRENFCVSACARFLRIREHRGHVWYLPDDEKAENGEIAALLLHSRRTLLPVFGGKSRIPHPRFLKRFLGKVPIHAVQGLREDTEILESLMEDQSYFASQRIDYDLMGLDCAPSDGEMRMAGLVLRPPQPEDEEALFALQSAYEQEEVLPQNAVFNPAACRLNLRHILDREFMLVAELDGQLVGKINTSAESFTRYQIGGVFVRPDCRRLGIGAKMAASFAQSLLARGKGLNLFVKKRNAAACKVYRKIGFNVLADYRITYY